MAKDKKKFTEDQFELRESITPVDTVGFEDLYVEGEEILTNKIWNGRKVYRQIVDFGALPNTTNKTVTFSPTVSSSLINEITDFHVLNDNGSNQELLGSFATGSGTVLWGVYTGGASLQASCTTDYNASAVSARCVVEYTRTDK